MSEWIAVDSAGLLDEKCAPIYMTEGAGGYAFVPWPGTVLRGGSCNLSFAFSAKLNYIQILCNISF